MSRFALASVALLSLSLAACDPGLDPYNKPVDSGNIDSDSEDSDTVGPENTAPVAVAGDDFIAMVGDLVLVDGSGSFDDDGDPLQFYWTLISKPQNSSAELSNPTEMTTEFVADAEGLYEVYLRVEDDWDAGTDQVTITVENQETAPVADAGPDQYVSVGDTVQLNGSNSFDPDGDPLSFSWRFVSQPSGSNASLDAPANPLPRFTATRAGAYEIELVVSDSTSPSSPDVIRVVAEGAGDEDCIACVGLAEQQLRRRWTVGDLASGPGLLALPLVVLFWQRTRRRED